MSDAKKRTNQVLNGLRKRGFTVEMTGGGHWLVTGGREPVYLATSPSDVRSLRNSVALLRKHGYMETKRRSRHAGGGIDQAALARAEAQAAAAPATPRRSSPYSCFQCTIDHGYPPTNSQWLCPFHERKRLEEAERRIGLRH